LLFGNRSGVSSGRTGGKKRGENRTAHDIPLGVAATVATAVAIGNR